MRTRVWAVLAGIALVVSVTGLTCQLDRVAADPQVRPTNVIVIYCDDLGYADLGIQGAQGIETPNIDRLAKEGVRLTNFYVAQPVCSASRTALLTGCYANRLGIHGALGPQAKHGINDNEVTLGELFKSKGYATGMAGKWHLGHLKQFLPIHHGFDEYLGLPYSNDMWPFHPDASPRTYPKLPLIEGDEVIDDEVTAADQATLTRRYTDRAVSFIERNAKRPFFFYLAHSMPHVPLFGDSAFRGRSKQGRYGDIIEELDWSVGQVMQALKKAGIDRETLVIFTSDNGPWLNYGDHAGSALPLREGKGTVWEGGVRVPFLARWPAAIPAGRVQAEPMMTIDLLPTLAKLIGADLPKHKIDGLDSWSILRGDSGAKNPHDAYAFYYQVGELQAIRSGKWKLILPHTYRTLGDRPGGTGGRPVAYKNIKINAPELYDLSKDVSEAQNVALENADVVAQLMKRVETIRDELGDSLSKRVGSGVREPGRVP